MYGYCSRTMQRQWHGSEKICFFVETNADNDQAAQTSKDTIFIEFEKWEGL